MNHTTEFTQLELEFPQTKLCECGCGQPAPIATYHRPKQGYIKGEPVRFVPGHNRRRPIEERFWSHVDKSGGEDSCWTWTGCDDGSGYGQIRIDGKSVKSHRVSWEIHFGPIPEHDSYHGMCVLHRCDNPSCVNPAHLFLGTNADNVADMIAKGRECHPGRLGESNGFAKLSEDQVRDIRIHAANGRTQGEIARDFGVKQATISTIVRRERWAHIE